MDECFANIGIFQMSGISATNVSGEDLRNEASRVRRDRRTLTKVIIQRRRREGNWNESSKIVWTVLYFMDL